MAEARGSKLQSQRLALTKSSVPWPKLQVLQLKKGLTKQEAFKVAAKKAKRDWRGITYDPKTGVAKCI